MNSQIIEKLLAAGLSEYEARAYLYLLGRNPASGYEIAKQSGIPSSKIYEVLRKLLARGMVLELQEKGKPGYVAQSWQDFLATMRRQFEKNLDFLEEAYPVKQDDSGANYIWTSEKQEEALDRAAVMIGQAQESILLSLWQEDLDALAKQLAAKKGSVRIALVVFADAIGNTPEWADSCFYHPIRDTIYNEKKGRGLVLVCDSAQALMASLSEAGNPEPDSRANAAWSSNPGFCTLAEDYIKHDIYIMKIVRRFDSDLKNSYGKRYELLRDIFSDCSLSVGNRP